MAKEDDIISKYFSPLELMELAYKESFLSISEHIDKPTFDLEIIIVDFGLKG